jgi:hypothetical protein
MMDWMRRLLDACRANRILPGLGYKLRETTSGTILEIVPGVGKSSPPQAYHFKEMRNDYLICRSWDGSDDGDNDIKIAKPGLLRFSLLTRTVSGIELTFSSYNLSDQTRISTKQGSPETEIIIDRYEVDDVIWGQSCATFVQDEDGNDVSILDLNVDGRYWGSI